MVLRRLPFGPTPLAQAFEKAGAAAGFQQHRLARGNLLLALEPLGGQGGGAMPGMLMEGGQRA